jgi:hypothetical protein
MDVEWSCTEGGGIDNIYNVVEAPLNYGYTASYNVAAGQCVVLNGSSRIDCTFACIIFEGNWNTQQSIVARWLLACIHCPHHPLVCCLYRKGWEYCCRLEVLFPQEGLALQKNPFLSP